MARSKSVKRECPYGVQTKALTDLPAGIIGESSDLHAMRGAARPWRTVAVLVESGAAGLFSVAGAASELDRETFTHKVGSVLRALLLARDVRFAGG
jgi:hypothetical protein